MNRPTIALFSLVTVIALFAFTVKPVKPAKPEKQKIQVAILLDVSNSMDGLIEQAKAQLWNMVNTMGKAKCDAGSPDIEIALYEYGRTSNDAKAGYVKQINGFISNLDSLSENLFNLTTNGGDEYCGQVIYTSIDQLQWDGNKNSYKVIFIAGNEDFLQGKIQYSEGCAKAKEKGIIVNTIYCGDKMQGIKEHWNLGAECGNGSFTNINPNARLENIITPYDSTLYSLNTKLNNTYISYGTLGFAASEKQAKMDDANKKMNNNVGIQRVVAKGKSNVYRNDEWDLVDGIANDKDLLKKIDPKLLPLNLRNKSKEEITLYVAEQSKSRNLVQAEIAAVSLKREAYLTEERKKRAENKNEPTLETEVEKIIKAQAKQFKMEL
jgi:hypothetical protein